MKRQREFAKEGRNVRKLKSTIYSKKKKKKKKKKRKLEKIRWKRQT